MIYIDWGTNIIHIPKEDTTLIQLTPTEIRELDLDSFRRTLKDIEDNSFGISYLKTHLHNTEVSLGGITYARIIEILNPYTITFENGQYSVNLVGANSNVGDKINANFVSVRSNNSAGLISTPLVEYDAFQGAVHIDITTQHVGTLFPIGTPLEKVNNVPDALLINTNRGFNKLRIYSPMTLGSDAIINDFVVYGREKIGTDIIVDPTAETNGTGFYECILSGTLSGDNTIVSSLLTDISNFSGKIDNSILNGKIVIGSEGAYINNCTMLKYGIIPEIDMGPPDTQLTMPNYSGSIKITNTTSTHTVNIGLNEGRVILDSATVTGGTIIVSGIGILVDENDNYIDTGIWNTNVTVVNSSISKELVDKILFETKATQSLLFAT